MRTRTAGDSGACRTPMDFRQGPPHRGCVRPCSGDRAELLAWPSDHSSSCCRRKALEIKASVPDVEMMLDLLGAW